MRQLVLLFVLTVLSLNSAFCQNPTTPDAAAGPRPSARMSRLEGQIGQRRNENIEAERRMEREQQKKANKDRQARIKRDTDRLLALATELKQYVDRSNENLLSVDVIRKAEEIEKLAHEVKQKMKEP